MTVQRWTSVSVEPCENGGFVAYGDYLELLRQKGEPVAWITKEQLDALTDLTADAWVYWRESGHVAEDDEIALYRATPSTQAVGELAVMLKRAKHALKNHGFSVLCGEIDELLAKHKESK